MINNTPPSVRPPADSGFKEGPASNSIKEDGRAWRERHNGLRVRREGVRVNRLIYEGLEWADGSDLSTGSASSMFFEPETKCLLLLNDITQHVFGDVLHRCNMFPRKCVGTVLHIGYLKGVAQSVFTWTSHHALR
ncbi:hypothetical protein M9H77_00405 [Catharanthus roseus]|nr:hypothetical protein M9H77_00405 [Catharanthus roseus]